MKNLPMAEIMERYKNGKSTIKLARIYGVSDGTISNRLKKAGAILRQRKNLPMDEIIKEYEDGKTTIELGKKYGISHATIGNQLKKTGIIRTISEARKLQWKQHKHPFLGHHHTEETKNKLREKNKGKHRSISTEFKKGLIPWHAGTRGKGIFPSPPHRKIFLPKEGFENLYLNQNLSTVEIAKLLDVKPLTINRWLERYGIKRRTLSEAHRLVIGSKHPRWKGGRDPYYGGDWHEQRRRVLKRDGYKCVICGKTKKENGRELDVHHIKSHRVVKENYISNLVTLCPKCHQGIHRRDNND